MPLIPPGGERRLESLNTIVEGGLRFCRYSERDFMSPIVLFTIDNLDSTTSDS